MAKHAASAPRMSLSSRVLIFLLLSYLLSLLLMALVPESQGLLVYAHWLRIPFFRDLTDLVSFRIPHGRNIQVCGDTRSVFCGPKRGGLRGGRRVFVLKTPGDFLECVILLQEQHAACGCLDH